MNLHANVRVGANDREGIKYLARPPIANDRLAQLPDGNLALRFKQAWRDGTTHIAFAPHEFRPAMVGRGLQLAVAVRMHMVFNGRMRLWGALMVLVELAGAGCIGNLDPCWSYTKLPMWCDGDKYMSCSEGSEVSASVPEVQMVCDPGMCVEWVDNGEEYAGCKASSSPCDRAQGQVCVGTVGAYCSSQGILIEIKDCAQSSAPYCTIGAYGGAICVQKVP